MLCACACTIVKVNHNFRSFHHVDMRLQLDDLLIISLAPDGSLFNNWKLPLVSLKRYSLHSGKLPDGSNLQSLWSSLSITLGCEWFGNKALFMCQGRLWYSCSLFLLAVSTSSFQRKKTCLWRREREIGLDLALRWYRMSEGTDLTFRWYRIFCHQKTGTSPFHTSVPLASYSNSF